MGQLAGILRKGPLVRLRTAQADKPGYAQALVYTRDRMLSILRELDTYRNENEGKDKIHLR
jgi:hypothetical protein